MKKFLSTITVVFLLSGLFFLTKSIDAATYILDQSCSNVSQWSYENIAINTPHEQGFRPTQNRIKEVNLKIGGINMTGGTPLRLKLLPFGSESVLAEKVIMPTVSGPSVRNWSFDSEITTTPNDRYVLRLEKTSGPGTPYWYTNSGDCYDRGTASKGGSVMGYDYDFATYGYTYTPPSNPPSTPDSGTTDTSSGNSSDSTTSASKIPATAQEAPIDPSIQKPTLTHIEKNSAKTDTPITKEVAVGMKDKLKLYGDSFPSAKVAVFYGEKGFAADVGADGKWSIDTPVSELSEGALTINGQSQKDGKGSEKVEFLKIKVLGAKSGTQSPVQALFGGWNIFCTLTAVGILLMVLMLLLLIAKRHKDIPKAGGTKKDKKK